MFCNLTEEQIDQFIDFVGASIESAKRNSSTPFDIKDFAKNLYSSVYDKSKNETLALNYVSMLPKVVDSYIFFSDDFKQYLLKDNKISKDYITDLIDAWSTLEGVKDFLEITDSKDNKSLIQDLILDTNTVILGSTNEQVYSEIEREYQESTKESIVYDLKIESVIGTTGQQAVDETSEDEDESDISKLTFYNTRDELRKIKEVQKVGYNSIIINSDLPNVPKVRGVKLKLMTNTELLALDENSVKYLRDKTVIEGKVQEAGIYAVVSDTLGNVLYFSPEGKLVDKSSGQPAITFVNKPVINKSTGEYELKYTYKDDSRVLTPIELALKAAKDSEIPLDVLEEMFNRQQQLEMTAIDELRTRIIKTGKSELVDISNITKGIIKLDFGNPIPLSNIKQPINFKGVDVDDPSLNLKKGGVYFDIPGVVSNVLLVRPSITKDIADEIVSLLGYTSKTKKELELIRGYVETLVYTNSTNLSITIEQNKEGLYKFKVLFNSKNSGLTATRFTNNYNSSNPADVANLTKFLTENKKLNISIKAINTNLRTFKLVDGKLAASEINYNEFLKNNFLTYLQLNSKGELKPLNGYIQFELPMVKAPTEVKVDVEVEPQNEVSSTPSDISSLDALEKDIDDKFGLFKNKSISNKATKEQIDAFQLWWVDSPLSKLIPFNVMFNVVNSNAFATFTEDGITLYEGANYTDGYHEAFHGFTQMYLTKSQKIQLYTEFRNLQGKFTTFKGVTKLYSDATYLEAEEFLAEDFRKYVLSDRKIILDNRPVRNNIFRRIYNFLKQLFTNTLQDGKTQDKIKELYDKLYLGQVNEYSPDVKNMMFGTLNSIKVKDYTLSAAESNLLVKTIDGWFRELLEKHDKAPSLFFEKPEALKLAYDYVSVRFNKLLFDNTLSESNKKLIKFTAVNFKEVVDYHNKKSKYLANNKIVDSLFDNDGNLIDTIEEGSDVSETELSKQNRDTISSKNGNEQSIKEMASNETLYLLSGLYQTDADGKVMYNELKAPILADFNKTWNRVIKTTQGSVSRQDMYQKLINNIDKYPEFAQLVKILGNPNSEEVNQNDLKWNTWSKFYQDMDKTRVPIQMGILEVVDGQLIYKFTEAAPALDAIRKDFTANFNTIKDSKYVFVDENGNNVLNVKAVIKDFGLQGKTDLALNSNKKIEFLEALGFKLSTDIDAIRLGLHDIDNSKYSYLLQALKALDDVGELITDPVEQLSNPFKKDGKVITAGESENIRRILNLEASFSDSYSNYSVVNPNGDREYEHSLNNFMTKMLNKLNYYKTYQEVQADNTLQQYNVDFNHYVENSEILHSLFVLDVPKTDVRWGTKRKNADGSDVTLDIINYSGLIYQQESGNEGSKTTDLNREAKFLLDLHSMLLHGVMENPRHASKNSAFAIVPSTRYHNYTNKKLNLYLNFDDFDYSNTMNQITFKVLSGYIKDELKGILKFKQGIGKDINIYNTHAGVFRVFDDILSDSLKDKLIKESTEANMDLIIEKYQGEIAKDLTKYFDQLTNEFVEIYNAAPAISKELVDKVKKTVDKPMTNTEVINLILKTFAYNSFINNVETTKIIYGDLAYYKTENEEGHKRNTSFSATGVMPITDGAALTRITNKGRLYARKMGIEEKPFTNKVSTVVVKDYKKGNMVSKYYDLYKQEWLKFFKEQGLSDNEAEQKSKVILSAYTEMNEADAQGFITFDFYRAYKISLGQWSGEEEKLYQEIVYGSLDITDNLTEDEIKLRKNLLANKAAIMFAPIKAQYSGPLGHESLSAPAFHKFSLVPLIPTVIEDTKFEAIHNNMMQKGVDYMLFNSGSKLATQVKEDGSFDKFYEDEESRTPYLGEYTINTVFLDFLKEQVKIESKFKGTVIFSTQLRKLVESGIFESGKALSDSIKQLADEYVSNIGLLTALKKQELLKEAGIEYINGEYKIEDYAPLVKLLHKELESRDLPENVIKFIDLDAKGKLIHPLDLSTHVQKIETMLQAIINNRLVKQKVNGEPLIQVASTGFEKYRNPTDNDLDTWGDNDLPTYKPGGLTRNGKTVTSAMKIKVALAGDFKLLLELPEVIKLSEERGISTIQALNTLIKDEKWLNTADNRKLVTMIGVRIPVQGLNSMEFMEVYEFLPEVAGNIIIPPSSIVAKSGSDFDIDKLNVFRPNLAKIGGKIIMFNKKDNFKTDTELADYYKPLIIKAKKDKEKFGEIFSKVLQNLTNSDSPLSREERTEVLNFKDNYYKEKFVLEYVKETALKEYLKLIKDGNTNEDILDDKYKNLMDVNAKIEKLSEDFYKSIAKYGDNFKDKYIDKLRAYSKAEQDLHDDLRTSRKGQIKSVENALIDNIRSILELPENFLDLTRPNGTDIVKPLADELEDEVSDYNAAKSKLHNGKVVYINKKTGVKKPKSDLTAAELKSGNWKKYVSATRFVELPYNLYKHTSNNTGKNILGVLAKDNTFHSLFKKTGAYLNTHYNVSKQGELVSKAVNFYFEHNKTADGKVSLSGAYDINHEHKIADVISQLMNGSVDVEKDAWISNLNGTLEAIPVISLLLQAGVPVKTVAKFITNPIILEYTKALKAKNNLFAKASNPDRFFDLRGQDIYKKTLQYNMLNNLGVKTSDNKPLSFQYFSLAKTNVKFTKEMFTEDNLRNPEYNAAFLLHFIELNDIASTLTEIKRALNFDTNKTSNSFTSTQKLDKYDEVLVTELLPKEVISAIKNNTAISSFAVQDLSLKVWTDLLPLRYHAGINKFISNKLVDIPINKRTKQSESFAKTFKNDFLLYLFQNSVIGKYKGLDTNLNSWFKGNNAIAKQLIELKTKYPDLAKKYSLVNDLRYDKSKDASVKVHNVKIIKPLNDTDLVNQYAEEFTALIDLDVLKTDDKDDNYEISWFFKRLAIFGFLQSGLNKSSVSFTEVIPQKVYTEVMKKVIDDSIKTLDYNQLSDFYSKFVVNNPKFFKYDKDSLKETERFKNYMSDYKPSEVSIEVPDESKPLSFGVDDSQDEQLPSPEQLRTNTEQDSDLTKNTPKFTYLGKSIDLLFSLSPDQEVALKSLIDFYKGTEPRIVLQGAAGTGKTSIIGYLQKYLNTQFLYTAPTHAATVELAIATMKTGNKVLPATVPSSLKTNPITGRKQLSAKASKKIGFGNTIIVDETSMLTTKDYESLKDLQYEGYKIIFLGDKKQIPEVTSKEDSSFDEPVKSISNAFIENPVINLDIIHRTSNNTIKSVLQKVRDSSIFKLFKPINNTENVKFIKNSVEFKRYLRDVVTKEPENTDYIGYTNVSVAAANKLIREGIFNRFGEIKEGDIVMGYSGYRSKQIERGQLANSVTFKVESVIKKDSSYVLILSSQRLNYLKQQGFKEVPEVFKTTLLPLSNSEFIENTFDEQDYENNNSYLSSYFEEAYNLLKTAKSPRDFGYFQDKIAELSEMLSNFDLADDYIYDYRENRMVKYNKSNYILNNPLKAAYGTNFNNFIFDKGIDFGHAITVHKSQGRTTKNVFFDADTLINRDINIFENGVQISTERQSLSYVGLSRASENLYVHEGWVEFEEIPNVKEESETNTEQLTQPVIPKVTQGNLFNQNTKLNAGLFTEYTNRTVEQSVTTLQERNKSLFNFNKFKLDSIKLESIIKTFSNSIGFKGLTNDVAFNREYTDFYRRFDFSSNNTILSTNLQELWNNRENNQKDFVLGLSLHVVNELTKSNSLFTRTVEQLRKSGIITNIPTIQLLNTVSNIEDFIYTQKDGIYFNPAYFNFLSRNAKTLDDVLNRLDLLFTEEIIHLSSLNMLTDEDVNNIYNELSDKEIKAITKLYNKNEEGKLSKESVVHEYVRMIVQNIIQDKTSELYSGKNFINKSSLYKFLVKLFNYILEVYNNKPNTSASKIVINKITNFISSDINTLWNENKDVILSKNPDTTFEVLNQMYNEFGLQTVEDFINKCKS